MGEKMNVIITGDSSFSWEFVAEVQGQIDGRLYFVLPDRDQALEAGLQEDVVAVHGDITDTEVLDQLDLVNCDMFIASSHKDQDNVLSALYAKNQGARHVYARISEKKFRPLLTSIGITPLQVSHIAASWMALSLLKPAVAELVSLTRGQFDLLEIRAARYPELVGCRLGHLQSENLHVIAIAQGDNVQLSYHAIVSEETALILVCDNRIKPRLHQELRKMAAQAAQRLKM